MALLFAGPAALVPAQDLQVITFTYETAQGIEEDEEEELEPTYVRHPCSPACAKTWATPPG